MAVTERSLRTPVSELEFVGCLTGKREAGRDRGARLGGPESGTLARSDRDGVDRAGAGQPVPRTAVAPLVERVCQARGSDAACFGGMDLRVRQEDGTLGDFMQADETVYLHPSRSKLP